jgi:phage-related baseplate assembly protein
MFYQFSSAPVLDYIAALVAIERLPEALSGCTVRFTLIEGHGNVVIPKGTRVSSSDEVAKFATVDDLIIPAETLQVEVEAVAEEPGKAANGYAAGEINTILDPFAFVSEVANVDVTGGGSDVETDDQLRERIRLSPSQCTSAGSRSSYLFYAKSASPLITDVSVSSPIPGVVFIAALTEEDETPLQVLTDIYNTCNAENVRPLTDIVIVQAAVPVDYSISVDITLYADADADVLQDAITSALQDYAKSKQLKLGQDIIRSHISQACRLEKVYDVNVVSPAENTVVSETQFANCEDITVTITGFNNG